MGPTATATEIELLQGMDPVVYAKESLGFHPDPWQEDMLRYEGQEMILNCCRQSGKSTTAAIKALHKAVYTPGSLTLLLSPSLRQSGELFRKVIQMSNMAKNSPAKTEDSKQFVTYVNGSRIVSLPGKEGTVRSYSAVDLLVEDEAAQVEDDLYRAVRPMLIISRGSIILMSTPRGKRGHFWQEWTNGGPSWKRIEVPASECPRISPEDLVKERIRLGQWWYKQEYECEFVETDEQIFTSELIGPAFQDDVKPLFEETALTDDVEPLFPEDE